MRFFAKISIPRTNSHEHIVAAQKCSDFLRKFQTGTGSCFSHSLAFVASCINYNKMPAGGRGFPNLPNDACEIWTTGAVNTQIALAPGTQHM